MRPFLFSILLLSSSVVLAKPIIDSARLLLETKQYSTLINQLSQTETLSVEQEVMYIRALMASTKRLEAADERATEAMKAYPNHARLHLAASLVKMQLAQHRSIFSARGHAKDAVALLKQAAALAPNDALVQFELIDFYTQAPGFAGGDDELALQLARQWQQRNPLEGSLALAHVLVLTEQYEEAGKLLEKLSNEYPTQPKIYGLKSLQARMRDKYNKGFEQLLLAINYTQTPSQRAEYQYVLGQLSAEHSIRPQRGITALKHYVDYYAKSEDKRLLWAKAWLARLYLAQQQDTLARPYIHDIRTAIQADKRLRVEMETHLEKLNIES